MEKYFLSDNYSFDELSSDTSLLSLASFLQNSDNYKIYHSVDDYLVNQTQLKKLKVCSGKKTILLSNGAHLGFMYTPEFLEDLRKEIALTEKTALNPWYNKTMKKVLCFGDSNTYGYIPSTGGRYDKNNRWTGILSNEFEIIEAGANNRNAFSDSPKLLTDYMKANPDIVILAIGINDTQKFFKTDIKDAIEKLIDIISPTPVILVAPSILGENVLKHPFF